MGGSEDGIERGGKGRKNKEKKYRLPLTLPFVCARIIVTRHTYGRLNLLSFGKIEKKRSWGGVRGRGNLVVSFHTVCPMLH